ncbi:MAG TPA: UdgX family uracil-DNA binding protein [Kofleriaceae bacterium]|jgi:DNA polymerase|nr:UdgX family uracil-DNA binding protein [Kofleriaceae bacterium]
MATRNPYPTAAAFLPKTRSLRALRIASQTCEGCDLYAHATQTVFGEGPVHARVVIVGEQPGDQEDRAGRPFVGPAGALLDEALAHAGIPRDDVYITNAVKHFKFTQRGKRRIHDKPTYYQVQACKPWLDEELDALEPEVIVLLGATAAQSRFGRAFKVTQHRGEAIAHDGRVVICTVHPASVLRAPDDDARRDAREAFMRDFSAVGAAYRRTQRSRAHETHASP